MAASSSEPLKAGVEHKEGLAEAGKHSPRSSSDSDGADSQAWDAFDEDWAEPAAPPTSSRNGNTDPDEEDGWVRNPLNPAEMSRWTGQPSIRGSSDAMRMILLNFCTLGITWVAT